MKRLFFLMGGMLFCLDYASDQGFRRELRNTSSGVDFEEEMRRVANERFPVGGNNLGDNNPPITYGPFDAFQMGQNSGRRLRQARGGRGNVPVPIIQDPDQLREEQTNLDTSNRQNIIGTLPWILGGINCLLVSYLLFPDHDESYTPDTLRPAAYCAATGMCLMGLGYLKWQDGQARVRAMRNIFYVQ